MKQITIIILSCLIISSCNLSVKTAKPLDKTATKSEVDSLMNSWHKAAAEANLTEYIGAMAEGSIYIGTDASENWDRDAFEEFCKPYFDKKTTWNFTPIERNIYISTDNKAAWFDELLITQMGICRGSGGLEMIGDQWKIKQYVLSMTVPNDRSKEVTAIKSEIENAFVKKLITN